MASESPPAAYSPEAKGDKDVFSQQTFPSLGEVAKSEAPVAEHQGESHPLETGGGGCIQFGPRPDPIPETGMALGSGT